MHHCMAITVNVCTAQTIQHVCKQENGTNLFDTTVYLLIYDVHLLVCSLIFLLSCLTFLSQVKCDPTYEKTKRSNVGIFSLLSFSLN